MRAEPSERAGHAAVAVYLDDKLVLRTWVVRCRLLSMRWNHGLAMDALLHVALGRGTSEGIGSERIDRRLAIGSGGRGREEVVPTEETRTRRRYLSILLALGTSSSLQGAGFDEVGRREHL